MRRAIVFASMLGALALASHLWGADKPSQLSLPAIFGDHMVLQQGREVPVWGKAEPGQTVRVTVNGKSAEALADAAGRWTVRLPAMATSKEPAQMTVQCGTATLSFEDVLIGDVWLCSGQSNMAMGVGAMKRGKEIAAAANHPRLRLFVVARHIAFDPSDEISGKWVVCSPESLLAAGNWGGFSAVAYFFGRTLEQSQEMPIGLVGTYVGGSHIFAWTSRDALAAAPARSIARKRLEETDRLKRDLPEWVRKYREELKPAWDKALAEQSNKFHAAMAEWKRASAAAHAAGQPAPPRPEAPSPPSRSPKDPLSDFHQASTLFNGMLHPLAPFSLRGVIWYQGEANAYPGMNQEYEANLHAMIQDWRSLWDQGEFPFLVVQLPNLISKQATWPTLRESQRRAVLNTPNTGLAVTYDVGDPKDIHPAEKQAVGERLALLARNLVYREDVVPCGPLVTLAKFDGGKVILSFQYADSGLMAGAIAEPATRATEVQAALRGFEAAGDDGKYFPVTAALAGNTVTVSAPANGIQVKSVRYAWAQNPDANLYNKDGLPAAPFEISVTR